MEKIQEKKICKERESAFWLEQKFYEKVKKISSYSLRSFANLLGVSPSYLSRVLRGERSLSVQTAIQIAGALTLPPKEREGFLNLVFQEQKKSKKKGPQQIASFDSSTDRQLSLDAFEVISQWYHYGITQLFCLEEFCEKESWMADMLGISTIEVRIALKRLQRLGIVDRDITGKLYRTATTLSTTTDIRSSGLRTFHKQILEKAITALEEVDIGKRDITSITMAINEDQLPKAKLEIKKFRKKLSRILETGTQTQVYNLGIHLIPISKSSQEEL
jgi:uncharacterized protein (TIGR02147 family)